MPSVNRTPIFVLTLEHRTDRQKSVQSSLNQVGTGFTYIISNKNEDQKSYEAMKMATQIEVAIWGSHVKAFQALLNTEAQWGLILEDDFLLTEAGLDLLQHQERIDSILESIGNYYSILQIGFLENSARFGLRSLMAKVFKIIFRFNRFDFRSHVLNLRYLGFKNRKSVDRVLRQNGLGTTKILFGQRLGTHACFVSRQAAEVLIDIFESRKSNPNFMVNDQFIINLTKNFSRKPVLRAARLSKSLVMQSLSPSDNVGRTPTQALNFDGKT
jgi:GR25 family glycosyltransferase involved in LPS biosynthesis